MSFLMQQRFTGTDLIFGSMVSISLATGHFIQAVCLAVLAVLIGGFLTQYGKHRQWQKLSRQGQYVEAIRMHRSLFKTGLKEAVDAVQKYERRIGIRP